MLQYHFARPLITNLKKGGLDCKQKFDMDIISYVMLKHREDWLLFVLLQKYVQQK